MLTNDTKSFVTLDTYTTRLYFHIAVQFRKLQFPQRAFAYFLRDRTNIHVFSVPYRFTRALWYRYPCTDRLEISRNTVSRERFIIALQSRMQEREAVSVSGKWSMPPRQASTLSSFIRLRPFLEPIPYSPGNIFTKRGGSQLADSKQRFDGTERSIDASESWSADFRRLKVVGKQLGNRPISRMEEKEDSSLLLFRRPTRVHIRNFGLPSLGTVDELENVWDQVLFRIFRSNIWKLSRRLEIERSF